MQAMENFYITTPIYYVNDRPHIGHAYTMTACDVLARFMRLAGKRVKFLTGTDEHGQKVEKSAALAGTPPKAFVDQVSQHFRDLTRTMNISNDDFIRTTDARHIAGAQGMWKTMQERGHIYLGSYAGWYAVRDEAFYGESELVDGKAPTGGSPGSATGCSRFTTRIPTSSCPPRAAMRSSASSRAASRISPSRARPSSGASPCRATRSTSCMSGSTRWSITSRRSATPI
jgi:methionyl-tRNA synthetase